MHSCLIPLFTLLLFSQQAAAQYFYIRSIYITIDTIVVAKNFDDDAMHLTPHMPLVLGHEETEGITDGIFDTFLVENTSIANKYPQFATRIYFDNYRRCALGIPVDDRGSKVWLANLNGLADTIHIQKWTMFHNDLPDSSWQKIEYAHCDSGSYDLYKGKIERFVIDRKATEKKPKIYSRRVDYLRNSGDSVVIYKTKLKTFRVKGYAPKRKDTYCFVLNGKEYSVPLSVVNNIEGIGATFHGYLKRKDQRRKYECDDCSYNYFHGTRNEKRHIYNGIVNL